MTSQTLTITRDALDLPDLVITNNPFASYLHIPEGGLARPSFGFRKTYAPDSGTLEGKQLLEAVRDQVQGVGWQIYAHGNTTAALLEAMREVEDAVGQWSWLATLATDGQPEGPYQADPVAPDWGVVDGGHVAAHMAIASLSLNLNPT